MLVKGPEPRRHHLPPTRAPAPSAPQGRVAHGPGPKPGQKAASAASAAGPAAGPAAGRAKALHHRPQGRRRLGGAELPTAASTAAAAAEVEGGDRVAGAQGWAGSPPRRVPGQERRGAEGEAGCGSNEHGRRAQREGRLVIRGPGRPRGRQRRRPAVPARPRRPGAKGRRVEDGPARACDEEGQLRGADPPPEEVGRPVRRTRQGRGGVQAQIFEAHELQHEPHRLRGYPRGFVKAAVQVEAAAQPQRSKRNRTGGRGGNVSLASRARRG